MLRALGDAGWHNYSLFLGQSGTLIGYFECDDLERAQAAMAASPINARWQAEMSRFFPSLDGTPPDEGIDPATEIFHLD
jgi:L-rhamnose mutarotase